MANQDVLTAGKILARTKLNSLNDVRNLNVWGNDLSDISILRSLPSVEVISLSVNRIHSLADLSNCSQLKELYLRKNQISELSELLYLTPLRNLRILWLSENPIAKLPHYREYTIAKLPQLQKLDNTDITEEEREVAIKRSSAGLLQLRPASISDADFLSPRDGGGAFASPMRSIEGQPHRRSFQFGGRALSPPSSPLPRNGGGGGGIGSPRRGDDASSAAAAGNFSPRKQYSLSSGSLASPRRDAQKKGYSMDGGDVEGEVGVGSPRRVYSINSPRAAVTSPQRGEGRPVIPALLFPPSSSPQQSVASARPPSGPVQRSPSNSNSSAHLHAQLQQQHAAAAASARRQALASEVAAENATRRRAEALEEEIRLLRVAEDIEREREKDMVRASALVSAVADRNSNSSRPTSPRRFEVKNGNSRPTSPLPSGRKSPAAGYGSPRAGNRSVAAPLSPRSQANAAAFISSSSSSSSSSSNAHPFTSNHVYGAQSHRPQTAVPAAGERPNHMPVFARGMAAAVPHSARPSTAAPSSMTPRSPMHIALPPQGVVREQQAHAAPPLSPRHYSMHSPPAPAASSSGGGGSYGMTPRGGQGNTQHNLLCAVVAMMEEFDVTHLRWLQENIQQRIDAKTR